MTEQQIIFSKADIRLEPLTKIVDHPSAAWNPRAWHIPKELIEEYLLDHPDATLPHYQDEVRERLK